MLAFEKTNIGSYRQHIHPEAPNSLPLCVFGAEPVAGLPGVRIPTTISHEKESEPSPPTSSFLFFLSLFSPLLLFPLDPELSPACCRRQNKEEYVPQDRQYHHELVIALVSPLASAAAYTARECIECLLYLRREYFDVIYRSILVLIQPP